MALQDIISYLTGIVKNSGKTSQSPMPTSAFPMDARTYFESLEEAQAAAAIAEQQGSTKSVFYYGLTVAVLSDDKTTVDYYIINPEKKLQKIILEGSIIDAGGAALADPESFS